MNDKSYHMNIDFYIIYSYIKLVIVVCSLFDVDHNTVNFEIFKLPTTSGYSANFVLFPGTQNCKIAPTLNIVMGGGQESTTAVRLEDEGGLCVFMYIKLNKLTFN